MLALAVGIVAELYCTVTLLPEAFALNTLPEPVRKPEALRVNDPVAVLVKVTLVPLITVARDNVPLLLITALSRNLTFTFLVIVVPAWMLRVLAKVYLTLCPNVPLPEISVPGDLKETDPEEVSAPSF